MKRFVALVIVALTITLLVLANDAYASPYRPQSSDTTPSPEDLITGAILYDRWYSALGQDAPAGDMPIWSRQTSNTRNGPETWRCVECHGWDYKGAQGAYGSGSHFTGFPGIAPLVAEMSVEDIVGHLKGSKDQSHDFSAYMDDASLEKLAAFLKYGMIDDDDYIDDVSLKVIGGNVENGKLKFESVCANCHGMDGTQIVLRSEGINESLGAVANRDPWRFLHRTRFGLAGVDMPVAAKLGWTVEDGRDVLAYVQSLPAAEEKATPMPASSYEDPSQSVGGPPQGWFGGLLTGLGAFGGMIGVATIIITLLLGIGALVVWALKKR